MRSVSAALLLGSNLATQAYAAPASGKDSDASVRFTEVTPDPHSFQPYNGSHLLLNVEADAGNGKAGGEPQAFSSSEAATGNKNLIIGFENKSKSKTLTAYVLGKTTSGAFVMLQSNGQFYFAQKGDGKPITADVGITITTSKAITLPDYLISARAYVAAGTLKFIANSDGSIGAPAPQTPSDANAGVNYGFAEFNNAPDSGLFANPSAVDFIGLPIGLKSGGTKTQTIPGPPSNGVELVCDDLKKVSKSNAPWANLCQTKSGKPLRVVAPHFQPDSFNGYWTDYVNKVYSQVKQISVTGNDKKKVTCTLSGSTYNCGDAGQFSKPVAADIFGCDSGPFSAAGASQGKINIIPQMCAAFNRGTLLLKGGTNQPDGVPVSEYYSTEPSNQYSKSIHKHEAGGQGYGFAYDDVSPGGSNTAGVISDPVPHKFILIAGGS